MRETAKSPETSLRQLQASADGMRETEHTVTVARVPQQTDLHGEVAESVIVEENSDELEKQHEEHCMVKWKKVLWSDDTKFKHVDHQTRNPAETKYGTSPQIHPPHCEAWW